MTRIESEVLNYKSRYEENGVLINKLGITDSKTLEKVERELTTFKLSKLYLNPGKQSFDINHYLSIHRYLFEDIYPFAGEIRSENIRKTTPFCLPQFIYQNLKCTLDDARYRLKGFDTIDKLISYLPELYSNLNVIHPFREGNGRTGREFIRQYVAFACEINNLGEYTVDFNVDKQEFINAVIEANIGSNDNLKSMFTTMAKGRNR